MNSGEPMLLRVEEVARALGLGRSKVFQMLAAGELPVVRIGRCVRVPREQLQDWILKRANEEGKRFHQEWVEHFAARKRALYPPPQGVGSGHQYPWSDKD